MKTRLLLCSAIAGALLGCDDEPTGPVALCRSPVAVTVSAGLTPTFNWSPACRVSVLAVRESATDLPMWMLFADPLQGSAIVPSVRYGSEPSGLLVDPQPAAELETGTAYVLHLTVIELLTGEVVIGHAEFTP